MIEIILIAGLLNTTLLVCFKKWGWLEWYAIRRLLWFPKADCYLCLGFWLAMIEAFPFAFIVDLMYLLVPFCSCALTNYLTNIAIIHDFNSSRK